MPNLPNWNTGSWGAGYGGNPVPSMFVPQQYANLSSLEAMFPGPSPFTVPGASLPPNTSADYAALRDLATRNQMSQVLNQYPTNFEPLNQTKPSGLFSRPAPGAGGGTTTVPFPNAGQGAPAAAGASSSPLPTRTPPTAGQRAPTYANVKMGGGQAGGTPTPGAGNASAATNPYSAFWGRNPLNIRTGLSPTGAVGSKLPGVLTANRGFGPSPTGAVGSRLPGMSQLTGAKNIGAGLGTALALQALPGLTAQGYTALTGNAPSQQGMETAQSSAGAAGLGLMFGAPVAAAAGLGTFVGDAVGSSGGLGVANTLRGWMGMDPTDDTIGDILGRAPIVGGWFGGGAADGEQAADPVAALPPTPDSIATVGQMAGLDASSTGFLQQQFANSVALSTAQYMADPETFQAQFEAQYGRPMESEADIAQVVFGRIVSEGLPAALENQSAQAAALQNAAMYQDFIGKYMQPIRDQYNDLGARASAAGYGDLALQFQGQGASQESAMRAMPNLEALRAQQAQVNQLAQQQWQASMSGTGATSDPLGDAATLASLGVPTG